MGEPLFGPAPFVAFIADPEVDPAAIASPLLAGDAIGDAAAFGAMSVVRAHIGDIVFSKTIHKAHIIRVAAQDPGDLMEGKDGKGVEPVIARVKRIRKQEVSP